MAKYTTIIIIIILILSSTVIKVQGEVMCCIGWMLSLFSRLYQKLFWDNNTSEAILFSQVNPKSCFIIAASDSNYCAILDGRESNLFMFLYTMVVSHTWPWSTKPGQFFEMEIYASSESWINHISTDVWFVMIGQYLKIWNLRDAKK